MENLRTDEELKQYILKLNKMDAFSLFRLQKKLEKKYQSSNLLSDLELLSCVVNTIERRIEMN